MPAIAIITTGPLFSDRAGPVTDAALHDAERAVAERGVQLVRAGLDVTLRHPTGRYRRRIAVFRRGPGWQVWDNRAIYGPWLEGTGSRNKTTRFKGYANFRRAAQQLDRVGFVDAERAVDLRVRGLS